MVSVTDAAYCGDIDYLTVYSAVSKSATEQYEKEDALFMTRPTVVPTEFRSRTKRDPGTSNRDTRGCCPLKPGFRCAAANGRTETSAVARAVRGFCYGEMCPYVRKRITENPRDVFGSRIGCDPDDFSLEVRERRRKLAQTESVTRTAIPWEL